MEFSTGLIQQRQRFFSPQGPSVGRPTLETDSSHLSEYEVIAEVQDQFKSPSEMAFSQGDQSITPPATIRIYRRVAQMESEEENCSLYGVWRIIAMALMTVFGLVRDAVQKYSWDIDLIVSRTEGAMICHSGGGK